MTVVLGSDFSAVGVTPTTSATKANGKPAKTTTTTAPDRSGHRLRTLRPISAEIRPSSVPRIRGVSPVR